MAMKMVYKHLKNDDHTLKKSCLLFITMNQIRNTESSSNIESNEKVLKMVRSRKKSEMSKTGPPIATESADTIGTVK